MCENLKLTDLLDADRVVMRLTPGPKESILRQLLEPLVELGVVHDPDEIIQSLVHREELMTTGVKQGMALPHAFTDQVNTPQCVVGLCPEGTPYESIDGSPTHCFIMLVEPVGSYRIHLRLLSRLSQLIGRPALVQTLLSAQSSEEVLGVLSTQEDTNPVEQGSKH